MAQSRGAVPIPPHMDNFGLNNPPPIWGIFIVSCPAAVSLLSSRGLFGDRKNVFTFLWVKPAAPRSYLLIVIPVLDTGTQVIIHYFLQK